MARKSRYSGVLKPVAVGRGSPEVSLVLIYDVEDDRIRTRVSETCLDYGLQRIQYSAFFGKLNRNRRQELALKLMNQIGKETARIRIIPVCADDLKDMWVVDQYRRDAEELKTEAEEREAAVSVPQLRILRQDD